MAPKIKSTRGKHTVVDLFDRLDIHKKRAVDPFHQLVTRHLLVRVHDGMSMRSDSPAFRKQTTKTGRSANRGVFVLLPPCRKCLNPPHLKNLLTR